MQSIKRSSTIVTFPSGTTAKKVSRKVPVDRSSGVITDIRVVVHESTGSDYILIGMDVQNSEVLPPLSTKMLDNPFHPKEKIDHEVAAIETVDLQFVIPNTLTGDFTVEVVIEKINL